MKRTVYPIHSDFQKWTKMKPPLKAELLPPTQKLMGMLFTREKSTPKLTVSHQEIPAADGTGIRALLYSPVSLKEPAPCLVYYHGGGFVFPAAPYHYELARAYALGASCRVLFVDYRLAPKYPFPVPMEDCYAAWCWAHEHGNGLGIDPARIAVGGDSAGGDLAAAVSLAARDRGQAVPCAQMLVYPVTDMRMITESVKTYTDTPMCNSRDMEKYREFYLPDPTAGKKDYASPIEAESLASLPPAYIETAEFDCLHDEGILYGERLQEFGVSVELHQTKGTMHGFDVVMESSIVKESIEKRVAFLKRSFQLSAPHRNQAFFTQS